MDFLEFVRDWSLQTPTNLDIVIIALVTANLILYELLSKS